MGRDKQIKGPKEIVHSVVSHDDLAIVKESLGNKTVSTFIREYIESCAEEERKKKQFKELVVTKDELSKSALGSMSDGISITNRSRNTSVIEYNPNNKLSLTVIKEYHIATAVDYGRKEPDIENIRAILPDVRQLYFIYEGRIREHDTPSKSKRRNRDLFYATTEGKMQLLEQKERGGSNNNDE